MRGEEGRGKKRGRRGQREFVCVCVCVCVYANANRFAAGPRGLGISRHRIQSRMLLAKQVFKPRPLGTLTFLLVLFFTIFLFSFFPFRILFQQDISIFRRIHTA